MKGSCMVWLMGIKHVTASPSCSLWAHGGPHEHRNMTMVDRCGALKQQLAAASKLAAGTHCTCHTLHAAAEVGVLQQWRNDGACRRAGWRF